MTLSAQELVAVIGAVAAALVAVITALGAVYVKIEQVHRLVNGRMDQLLEETRHSAQLAERALPSKETGGR